MDIIALVERIPPTFLGIIIGSLFTIIGVVLTNASNTRRLRLQHEHERKMESKNQDLSMRRDIYLDAMEAISAGLVAVGRFSDLNVSHQELMQSYTDRSPSISKVTIVGNEETIKAVANFSQELTGTFLRLASKREKLAMLWQRSEAVDNEIERASREQDRLLALMKQNDGTQPADNRRNVLRQQYEVERQRVEALRAEQSEIESKLTSNQMNLVQRCITEIATLDRLLVPVISLMRAELELPFNEGFYSQIIEEGHKKQAEFLEAFIRDQALDFEADSARESSYKE